MIEKSILTPISLKNYSTPRFQYQFSQNSSGIKETLSDRFIPIRSQQDSSNSDLFDCDSMQFSPQNSKNHSSHFYSQSAIQFAKSPYCELLKETIKMEDKAHLNNIRKKLCFDENSQPILSFRSEYTKVACSMDKDVYKPLISIDKIKPSFIRKIPINPNLVLDAPGLKDEPLRNILDWSKNDIISVGIGKTLYGMKLKDKMSAEVLIELNVTSNISAVGFNPTGEILASGLDSGLCALVDPIYSKPLFCYKMYSAPITSLIWKNQNIFTAACFDGHLIDCDIRQKDCFVMNREIKGQILNAKWSYDENNLCCSTNEGKVFLYDSRKLANSMKIVDWEYAIRGLDWSENNIIGCGNTAGRMKLFDVKNMKTMNEMDTGFPIWSLIFSKTSEEFVTGHSEIGGNAYPINIWKNQDFMQIGTLLKNHSRILHMGISPDGSTLVTANGEERLRFWEIFPAKKIDANEEFSENSAVKPTYMELR